VHRLPPVSRRKRNERSPGTAVGPRPRSKGWLDAKTPAGRAYVTRAVYMGPWQPHYNPDFLRVPPTKVGQEALLLPALSAHRPSSHSFKPQLSTLNLDYGQKETLARRTVTSPQRCSVAFLSTRPRFSSARYYSGPDSRMVTLGHDPVSISDPWPKKLNSSFFARSERTAENNVLDAPLRR